MLTSSAKAKGREFQKYLSKRFTEFFKLREGDITSRGMGGQGEDLIFSPLAREEFPVSIEAKSTTVTPGTSALKQAKANAQAFVPILIWKPRGVGPEKCRIIMELEDLLKLIDYYKGSK